MDIGRKFGVKDSRDLRKVTKWPVLVYKGEHSSMSTRSCIQSFIGNEMTESLNHSNDLWAAKLDVLSIVISGSSAKRAH